MLDYRLFKEINDLFAAGRHDKARRLLMEVQSRGIALHDEISMLKARLKNLEDAICLAETLTLEKGFYWLSAGGLRQGPFCPRCYEYEGGLIRLERARGSLCCPYCHATYQGIQNEAKYSSNATGRQARIIPFAR